VPPLLKAKLAMRGRRRQTNRRGGATERRDNAVQAQWRLALWIGGPLTNGAKKQARKIPCLEWSLYA